MALVVVLFVGWPAMLASLWLMVLGLRRSRPGLALCGALLGTPFLLYLAGSPRFRDVALLSMLLYYAAPAAIAFSRRRLAVACAAPYAALVMAVAWLALRSPV